MGYDVIVTGMLLNKFDLAVTMFSSTTELIDEWSKNLEQKDLVINHEDKKVVGKLKKIYLKYGDIYLESIVHKQYDSRLFQYYSYTSHTEFSVHNNIVLPMSQELLNVSLVVQSRLELPKVKISLYEQIASNIIHVFVAFKYGKLQIDEHLQQSLNRIPIIDASNNQVGRLIAIDKKNHLLKGIITEYVDHCMDGFEFVFTTKPSITKNVFVFQKQLEHILLTYSGYDSYKLFLSSTLNA